MPTPFPASLDPLNPGDPTRVGPYRIVGRLGAGGMGAVYGALDSENRCLAVKLVHREFAENDEFRARFAREVRLVEQVRARCAPAFAGADPEADTPWLATEYVPGPTLRQHVHAAGPLADGMLLAFAAGLAEALHAIHAVGVVHRDLKPSNVILAPDGPKVLDFGIARALDGTGLTRTGGLMGSPGWIAPERYHGAEASPAADIFAWGGLVAFAATGRAPFGTGTPQVVAARTMKGQADVTGLPSFVRNLVTLALATDASQRPHASALLGELGTTWGVDSQALSQPATLVEPLLAAAWSTLPRTTVEDWTGIAPSRRTWIWPGAAAFCVVALAGALATWNFSKPIESPDELNESESNESLEDPEQHSTTEEHQTHENSAHNPGEFDHYFDDGAVVSVEMSEVRTTSSEIEFTGRAEHVSDSGSVEFGTNFYTPYDYQDSQHPSFAMETQVWPTPGETFGVLSPENPSIEFTITIQDESPADPGAIFFNMNGAETDPHLCYRTEPYAETGTQFLHNAGDSWQDCAEDPYE